MCKVIPPFILWVDNTTPFLYRNFTLHLPIYEPLFHLPAGYSDHDIGVRGAGWSSRISRSPFNSGKFSESTIAQFLTASPISLVIRAGLKGMVHCTEILGVHKGNLRYENATFFKLLKSTQLNYDLPIKYEVVGGKRSFKTNLKMTASRVHIFF